MLRKFGKILGCAIAVMCMVSTLAVAVEMTCIQDDRQGTCTGGQGPDGRHIVVVGKGVKMGEKMDCVDKDNVIECKPMKQMQHKP